MGYYSLLSCCRPAARDADGYLSRIPDRLLTGRAIAHLQRLLSLTLQLRIITLQREVDQHCHG